MGCGIEDGCFLNCSSAEAFLWSSVVESLVGLLLELDY